MLNAFEEIKRLTTIQGIKKDVLIKLLNEKRCKEYTVKQNLDNGILLYNSKTGNNFILNCIKSEIKNIKLDDLNCNYEDDCSSCYINYLSKK